MSVLKEGFLQKYSSGIFKGWKSRYFILYSDGHFAIFDDKGGPRAGKFYMPRDCHDIQVGAGIQAKIPQLPTSHSVDCVMLFVARDKRFLLLAQSRSELDSWMKVLNQARTVSSAAASHSTKGSYATQSSYPTQSSEFVSKTSAPTQSTRPPPYTAYPHAPGPGHPPRGPSLGFENVGASNPPQGGPYLPQAGPYPPQNAGYAPHPPPASASAAGGYPQAAYPQGPYPPQQFGYQQTPAPGGYPHAPPPGGYHQAPPPGGYHQAPPHGGYHQAPPHGGYPQAYAPPPQGAYNPSAYGYPQAAYGTPYGQPMYQQPHSSKSSGGLAGGLGAITGGLGAMALGKKTKKIKHKKLIGGTAAALVGGYAISKMGRRGSWGSWSSGSFGSFGSSGSFGSFGSFGS